MGDLLQVSPAIKPLYTHWHFIERGKTAPCRVTAPYISP